MNSQGFRTLKNQTKASTQRSPQDVDGPRFVNLSEKFKKRRDESKKRKSKDFTADGSRSRSLSETIKKFGKLIQLQEAEKAKAPHQFVEDHDRSNSATSVHQHSDSPDPDPPRALPGSKNIYPRSKIQTPQRQTHREPFKTLTPSSTVASNKQKSRLQPQTTTPRHSTKLTPTKASPRPVKESSYGIEPDPTPPKPSTMSLLNSIRSKQAKPSPTNPTKPTENPNFEGITSPKTKEGTFGRYTPARRHPDEELMVEDAYMSNHLLPQATIDSRRSSNPHDVFSRQSSRGLLVRNSGGKPENWASHSLRDGFGDQFASKQLASPRKAGLDSGTKWHLSSSLRKVNTSHFHSSSMKSLLGSKEPQPRHTGGARADPPKQSLSPVKELVRSSLPGTRQSSHDYLHNQNLNGFGNASRAFDTLEKFRHEVTKVYGMFDITLKQLKAVNTGHRQTSLQNDRREKEFEAKVKKLLKHLSHMVTDQQKYYQENV